MRGVTREACLARPTSQARTVTRKKEFSCPADHKQDWQPYPVDAQHAERTTIQYMHAHISTPPLEKSGYKELDLNSTIGPDYAATCD